MIPSNKIIENLYTKGGQYIPKDAKDILETFIGFYNILFNGKIYSGKTYTVDSVELISVEDFKKNEYLSVEQSSDDTINGMKYFIQDDSISDEIRFKQISANDYNIIAQKPLQDRGGVKLIAASYDDLINNLDELDKRYPGFAAYYTQDADADDNIVKKNYSVSFDFNS